jgi:uncharacterized protein
MSNTMPDSLDPWRMVQARRLFEGSLPLGQLKRLLASLASAQGEARFKVEFGVDEYEVDFVDIRIDADLPMICQRTMAVYLQPVCVAQRLGLIRDEADEAALPGHYEALLVTDGQLQLKEVIEDELILALPLVALSPGAPLEQVPVTAGSLPESEAPENPFSVLEQWKKSSH